MISENLDVSNAKKIWFTIPEENNRNGIVKVVINLVDVLRKTGRYKISVVVLGPKRNSIDVFPDTVVYHMVEKQNMTKLGKMVAIWKGLKKLFAQDQPDVLIVSAMEFVPVVALHMLNLRHTKMIAWEHRHFHACPLFRLEWFGKRIAMYWWDAVICLTKKDFEQYNHSFFLKAELHQIYNLTTCNIERVQYNAQSRRIMSCGYLSHIKGFDLLLEVAAKVFKEYPEWRWDIYGEGEERKKLEKLIAQYGLEKYVCLKGHSTHISDLYRNYGVFVFTSRAEGLGMVLVEALRAGIPVVSFDICCGPSDVVKDGINGYLVRPFDLNDMAKKIKKLIYQKELRVRFYKNSEVGLSEFDEKYIITKWEKIL